MINTHPRNLSSSSPALMHSVKTQPRVRKLEKNFTEKNVSLTQRPKSFEEMTLDEQVNLMTSELLSSPASTTDYAQKADDSRSIHKLLQIHIIEISKNKKTIKKISKSVYKHLEKPKLDNQVIDLLQNCYVLFKDSEVSKGINKIITAITPPGMSRTQKIHSIVVNDFFSPLILKIPLKGSQSRQAKIIAKRAKETMDILHIVFPSSNLTSPAHDIHDKCTTLYKDIMDVLAPITAEEANGLIEYKISFKEAVEDRRLFLDMKEKLATKQQDELFIFIEQLKGLSTQLEFKKLIAESEINLSQMEKEKLQKITEDAFKSENVCLTQLIEKIVDTMSSQISIMWLGMLFDYTELLST